MLRLSVAARLASKRINKCEGKADRKPCFLTVSNADRFRQNYCERFGKMFMRGDKCHDNALAINHPGRRFTGKWCLTQAAICKYSSELCMHDIKAERISVSLPRTCTPKRSQKIATVSIQTFLWLSCCSQMQNPQQVRLHHKSSNFKRITVRVAR